jgi:hypothetical protein
MGISVPAVNDDRGRTTKQRGQQNSFVEFASTNQVKSFLPLNRGLAIRKKGQQNSPAAI